MPGGGNIRGRVNDFLQRQLSFVGTPSSTSANEKASTPSAGHKPVNGHRPQRSASFKDGCTKSTKRGPKGETQTDTNGNGQGSFINRYLNGQLQKHHPDIICGKSCYDLPVKEINRLSKKVISAYTGPGAGLTQVNQRRSRAFELPTDAEVDFIDEDNAQSDESLSQPLPVQTKDPSRDKVNNNSIQQNSSSGSSSESEAEATTGVGTSLSYHSRATLPLGEEIAGMTAWNHPSDTAYGVATTLYESHPSTKARAGEPIADAFGICVRENSAILALADGVNWGEKASLAAKCAVHGCIDYLNKALYHEAGRIENTMDIFICLLRSFSAAHNLILQENGMLTTLTVAVVAQLKNSDRFIVCTCNVGDSLAYVYNKDHGVREITQGSHDIFSMRDMRDALGALGPVDGQNPELSNLTVAMTIVEEGDIVFLTSDGVSDNFDPVVGKFAIPRKPHPNKQNQAQGEGKQPNGNSSSTSASSKNGVNGSQANKRSHQVRLKRSNSNPDRDSALAPSPNPGLPTVTAEQRHELTLLRMEDLIINGVNEGDVACKSAKGLCDVMISFASKLTTAKRRILEDPDLYDDNESFGQYEQRQRRRRVGDKLALVPGKLDHASIVAYKVAFTGDYLGKSFEKDREEGDKKYNLKLKATLARFESQEDFSSLSPDSPV